MKQDDRNIEEIDMFEEYEMIPLEPMMYGYDQMNMMPDMDTDTDTGMNPWMETGQLNDNMFMSGFNPMSRMYGDVSMKNAQDENKDEYSRPSKFNVKHNDVDSIVRRIERYNPLVFRLLNRCGMPYAQAKEVVRRIVRLTLMYSEE
jgi:hypothetical protein